MRLLSNMRIDVEIEVASEDALELDDEGKVKGVEFKASSSPSLSLCDPGSGWGICRCPEHVARTDPEG